MTREVRNLAGEVRRAEARAEGGVRPIAGYAAVFNRDANIGGWFIERVAVGAFAAAIERDDVRCLFNHSAMHVIGRNKAGTLRLAEDAKGLAYDADPPDAGWARDLCVSIERGDINQSSFQFRATRQEWDESGELPIRTILEVELFDVAPVTFPAYDETEAGVRAKALVLEARAAGMLTRPEQELVDAARAFRMRAAVDLRERIRRA